MMIAVGSVDQLIMMMMMVMYVCMLLGIVVISKSQMSLAQTPRVQISEL